MFFVFLLDLPSVTELPLTSALLSSLASGCWPLEQGSLLLEAFKNIPSPRCLVDRGDIGPMVATPYPRKGFVRPRPDDCSLTALSSPLDNSGTFGVTPSSWRILSLRFLRLRLSTISAASSVVLGLCCVFMSDSSSSPPNNARSFSNFPLCRPFLSPPFILTIPLLILPIDLETILSFPKAGSSSVLLSSLITESRGSSFRRCRLLLLVEPTIPDSRDCANRGGMLAISGSKVGLLVRVESEGFLVPGAVPDRVKTGARDGSESVPKCGNRDTKDDFVHIRRPEGSAPAFNSDATSGGSFSSSARNT
mmetsp:Transcript_43626/g.70168  ORF Transcript_43626/g.70168 Transcript_43626/m.70168 type:complete len:307 (-) Transcript_43626:548-1468(-)